MGAPSSHDIGNLAGRVGIASIKKLYELAEDHYKYAMSADIVWKRDADIRAEILVQPPEFEKLCARLAERSEESTEDLTVDGRLVGINVETGTFHLTVPEGEDIKGRLGGGFKDGNPSEVPGNYISALVKTTVIYYSTKEDKVTYELVELRRK